MRPVQRGISALFLVVAILTIAVALTAGYFAFYIDAKKTGKLSPNEVNSFEDCAKHYPVMESYPEQCKTPDGKHFTRELSEEEKQRLVPLKESSQSADEYTSWRTYQNDYFSFKYPNNWFYEKNPNSSSVSLSFFEVGNKPDHGYADHTGNEAFSFELSENPTSLKELKAQYYPDSTELTIDGKSALKTSFGLLVIRVDERKKLNIITGLPKAKDYSQGIISSLKFLK